MTEPLTAETMDPHGYTDELPPRKPDPVAPHIHVAWYDGAGKLTRTCGSCGRDLQHESHYGMAT